MTFERFLKMIIGYAAEIGFPLVENDVEKISSTTIAIAVDDKRRVDFLKGLAKRVRSARYDPTPQPKAALGVVKYGTFQIRIKAKDKVGIGRPGAGNEGILLNSVNAACEDGPITVVFKSKTDRFEVKNVYKAVDASKETKGRKKADVVLRCTNGRLSVPISVKKANSPSWESADSYWRENAEKAVDMAVAKGRVKLKEISGVYQIEPASIAVEANDVERRDVVFGSDLEGAGAVIVRTYKPTDFSIVDGELVIEVDSIIRSLADLKKSGKDVMFVIRKDASRRGIKKYPGLRISAVPLNKIDSTAVRFTRAELRGLS